MHFALDHPFCVSCARQLRIGELLGRAAWAQIAATCERVSLPAPESAELKWLDRIEAWPPSETAAHNRRAAW